MIRTAFGCSADSPRFRIALTTGRRTTSETGSSGKEVTAQRLLTGTRAAMYREAI